MFLEAIRIAESVNAKIILFENVVRFLSKRIAKDSKTLVLDKLLEEENELREANSPAESLAEFGDILFTLVNLGRWMGIHAEDSLRQANKRFSERYIVLEKIARSRAIDLKSVSSEEKELLWQEAKKTVRHSSET